MEVTCDKIMTHAKIWNDDVFDDDVSILIINLCQYNVKILISFSSFLIVSIKCSIKMKIKIKFVTK